MTLLKALFQGPVEGIALEDVFESSIATTARACQQAFEFLGQYLDKGYLRKILTGKPDSDRFAKIDGALEKTVESYVESAKGVWKQLPETLLASLRPLFDHLCRVIHKNT